MAALPSVLDGGILNLTSTSSLEQKAKMTVFLNSLFCIYVYFETGFFSFFSCRSLHTLPHMCAHTLARAKYTHIFGRMTKARNN